MEPEEEPDPANRNLDVWQVCSGAGVMPSWIGPAHRHIPSAGEFNPSGHIKTLRVRVFVWNHSNPTSYPNHADDPSSTAFLTSVLESVNQDYLTNVELPTDPSPDMSANWPNFVEFPSACGDPALDWYACFRDTHIRLQVMGVHFSTNDDMAEKGLGNNDRTDLNNAAIDLVPESERDLKIHIIARPGGGVFGDAYASMSRNQYQLGQSTAEGITSHYTPIAAFLARHWAHELGHVMGLLHTYNSSTTLIGPHNGGNFDQGPTFQANGWSVSNASNGPWEVGTLYNTSAPFSGNSAYISMDGGATSSYNPNLPATSYFWRNVTVPSLHTTIRLTFDWFQVGQANTDIWQVWYAPTTVVPEAVNAFPGAGQTGPVPVAIQGATNVGGGTNIGCNTSTTFTADLPSSLAGTTFRLIFSWKSNASVGGVCPAAIDNIILSAASNNLNAAEPCFGGSGGNAILGQQYLHDVLGRYVAATPIDPIRPYVGCPTVVECPECLLIASAACTTNTSAWDRCTNNIMGNNGSARFTSPLQMGRMHQMLMLSAASRYAWGYDPQEFVFNNVFFQLYEFATSYTIARPVKFYQDVHVPRGVVVRVTCRVDMVPEARWVVEPGGKLIIDGGIIRAAEFADAKWRGIEVWGDGALSYTPLVINQIGGTLTVFEDHGIVEIINGGEVRDAEIGILSGSRDDMTEAGGSIQIQGTPGVVAGTFRNCTVGVDLRPYYMGDHASIFNYAAFRYWDTALPGSDGPYLEAHARLTGVRPITFTGCVFENIQEGLTESQQLGFGIDAFESAVYVLPGCPAPPTICDPSTQVNTLFLNLDHGVHATAAGSVNTWLTVEGATFRDNVCGVYAAGLQAPIVRDCDFEMGGLNVAMNSNPYATDWFGFHRGIYTTDCYALEIQDNHVYRSVAGQSTSVAYEGIVVGYTRDNNEVVFRNTVEGAENGFVGEGICVDNTIEDGEYLSKVIGLQFHCNTNVGNTKNILSRVAVSEQASQWPYHSIRGSQGGYQLAAGNVFDQNPSGEHRDFFMNTVWENVISPFYDDAFVTQEPIYNTYGEPSLPDPNVPVYVIPGVADAAAPNACTAGAGGTPGGSVTAGDLEEYRTQYANVRYLYEQLLDGGNTDEVVQGVMDTWPQDVWELRDDLLALSPFLTVEVLKTLWEQIYVPLAIKAEILIANPEATQSSGFMPWAEHQADPPLPAYLVAGIEASWDERTYRSHLQSQLGYHHARMSQATYRLVRHYNEQSEPDSVRWAWQQLRTPAARYAEAMWLVGLGHYTEADSLLEVMGTEHPLDPAQEDERDRMRTLLGVFATAAMESRSIHDLNTSELGGLHDLYNLGYDRAGVWAALIHNRYGEVHLPLHTGGGGGEKSARPRGRKERVAPTTANGSLQVYPNPAQHWAAMDYHLPEGVRQGTLLVRDATGREVARLAANGAQGQRLWDTRRAQPGLYTVELLGDGLRLASTKLIVGQ